MSSTETPRPTSTEALRPSSLSQQSQVDGGQGSSSANSTMIIIVLSVALAIFVLIVASYTYLRRLRRLGKTPRFLPKGLLGSWNKWNPKSKYSTVNSTERGEALQADTAYRGQDEQVAMSTTAAGVDRNTSVRSVMTLPSYSQTPKETEQVIGREGERGGMDTVVEFPETQEEEEQARDAEMESLFQIREARRREIAEREARRQERREARDRGDWARLEELRRESRQRTQARNGSTGNITADTLIAEHASRPKDRRVSRVAYAEVGQVRHDGTRVRANSAESERGGLLSGAAPMGQEGHGRNASDVSLTSLDTLSRPNLPFARERSDSGALSISTVSSFDFPEPTPNTVDEPGNRSHDNSTSTTGSPGAQRLTPPTDGDSDEHGGPQPPDYEFISWGDAPAYEERMRRAESQRSARLSVPVIQVQAASEPNSPALGRVSEDSEQRRGS